MSRTRPLAGVDEHVGGLEVLVDQPASVEPTDSAGQRHRESEELSDLHRLADKAIKGLASGVIDHQHRPPALTHQLHWPQLPRRPSR